MTVPKNTSLTLLSWEALAAHGESTHVDFKAPMSFKDETRGWLAKHIIGLSNVRDGGKLIIGVTEDSSKRPIPTGVTDEQAKTFDSTPIATYVNKYVEPPVRLSVGTIEDGGARLIVINVEEFATTPTICTKSGPPDSKNPDKQVFYEGDILIRTDQAETRKVRTAEEMRALIRLAVSKTGDELLHQVRRILDGRPQSAVRSVSDIHAEALAMWNEHKPPSEPLLQIKFLPLEELIAAPDQFKLSAAVRAAEVRLVNFEFPYLSAEIYNRTNAVQGELRSPQYYEFWQMHRSGAFLCDQRLSDSVLGGRTAGRALHFKNGFYMIALSLEFAKRLYDTIGFIGDIEFSISFTDMASRKLAFDGPSFHQHQYMAKDSVIAISGAISTAELNAGWEPLAIAVGKQVFAHFNYDVSDRILQNLVERVRRNEW